MKKIWVVAAGVLTLAFSFNARAIELRAGDQITIDKPVHGDLYVTGGTIIINAPVYGDLVVSGGTITVNERITFDVIAAGGEIFINGVVEDDIRIAGGRVHLLGQVGGDVIAAGGSIVIAKSSNIAGSLLVAGGEVTINGVVEGLVKAGAGKLNLNGVVKKELECRGGTVIIEGQVFGKSSIAAEFIELGSNAEFHNDVRYWNDNGSLDFKESLKQGVSTFDESLEIESGQWKYLGFATALALIGFLGAALLMIFIMQFLFGPTFQKAASTVLSETLKSFGAGILFVIVVPVIIIISFITIVGIPLGLIFLAVYLIVFMLATSITSVVAANWLNKVYYGGSWTTVKMVFAAFAIFILLKLFSLTPFIGFPITAIIVCMAWGSILLNMKWSRQRTNAETTQPQ